MGAGQKISGLTHLPVGLGQQKNNGFLAWPKPNPIWGLNGSTHKKKNKSDECLICHSSSKIRPSNCPFPGLGCSTSILLDASTTNTSFGLIVTVFCDSIDIYPVSVAFHFASLPSLRWFICAFRFKIEPIYSLQELLTLSSLTKLVNHSPTSGSTRNGKKVFMLHQWQLQEAAGV